jgi:hypothetical protein
MNIKRRTRGVLIVASLAGALALSTVPGGAWASARVSPPTLPLRIEPQYGLAGTTVQVKGKLLPCSKVIISWNEVAGRSKDLATGRVRNGTLIAQVTIPLDAHPGPGSIVVAGSDPQCATSGAFYVYSCCLGQIDGLAPASVRTGNSKSLPDPGALATVMLSPTLGPPRTPVQVRGAGFQCTARVFLYWQYAQGSDYLTSANVNDGTFSASVTVPVDAPDGTSHVRAVATAPGCYAQASFTVCRFCQDGVLDSERTRR